MERFWVGQPLFLQHTNTWGRICVEFASGYMKTSASLPSLAHHLFICTAHFRAGGRCLLGEPTGPTYGCM